MGASMTGGNPENWARNGVCGGGGWGISGGKMIINLLNIKPYHLNL